MKYEIIKARPILNEGEIKRLWQNNLGQTFNGRFSWLYEDAPYGDLSTWLARPEDDEKPVACASLLPRKIKFGNDSGLIGIAADFAADPKHRVFGPAINLQRKLTAEFQQLGLKLLLAYPNENGSGVFKRIGYKPLGMARTWIKVLKTYKQIQKVIKFKMLAKAVGSCIDWSFFLIDKFYALFLCSGYYGNNSDTISEKCDALWNNHKSAYKLIGHKTKHFLNWRFIQTDNESYRVFSIQDKNTGDMSGYLYYTVKDDTAFIVDFFAQNELKIFRVLFLLFSNFIRRSAVEKIYLTFLGNSIISKAVKTLSFVERENNRAVYLFVSEKMDVKLREYVFDSENWFLSDGEMDI